MVDDAALALALAGASSAALADFAAATECSIQDDDEEDDIEDSNSPFSLSIVRRLIFILCNISCCEHATTAVDAPPLLFFF